MIIQDTSPSQDPTIKDAQILRECRALLLSEIERLKAAPEDLLPISTHVYGLEREYNLLVDEEAQITLDRHVDPLQVLPPELWAGIIPNDIDETLKLTLVSRKWCQTVLSMPQLWTNVTLSTRREDSLAKAITSLHLSGSLKIRLEIDIPLPLWVEVAPRFVASSHRISVLALRWYDDAEVLLRLLSQFGSLPSLRSIVALPGYHVEKWPQTGNLNLGPASSQKNNSLIFMEMPSLVHYAGSVALTSGNILALRNLKEIEVARLLPDVAQA